MGTFALTSCSPWCRALAEWRQAVLRLLQQHLWKTVQGCPHNVDQSFLSGHFGNRWSLSLLFTSCVYLSREGSFHREVLCDVGPLVPWKKNEVLYKQTYQSKLENSLSRNDRLLEPFLNFENFIKLNGIKLYVSKGSFLGWIPTTFLKNSFTISYIYNVLWSYSLYYPLNLVILSNHQIPPNKSPSFQVFCCCFSLPPSPSAAPPTMCGWSPHCI